MKFLSLELLLPCLRILDFGTKSGSLAIMVEVGSEDSVRIVVYRDVATDGTPETHSLQGNDILSLAVNLTYIDEVVVNSLCLLDHFGILCFSLLAVKSADIERIEYLFLLVERNVGILLALERQRYESQEESYDYYQYCTMVFVFILYLLSSNV